MKILLLLFVLSVSYARKRESSTQQEDFEFVEDSAPKSPKGSKDGLVWILDPDNELCSLLRCGSSALCLLQDKFTAVCVNKHEAAKYGDRIVSAKKETTSPNTRNPTDSDFGKDYDDEDYEDEGEDIDEDSDEVDDVRTLNEEVQNSKSKPRSNTNDRKSSRPKLNRSPFARKQCSTCPVVRPVFLCGSDNKTYSSLCRIRYHNCLHDQAVKISCKGFCPCKDPNSHAMKKERQRKRMRAYMTKLHTTLKEEQKDDENTVTSPVTSQSQSQSERRGKNRSTNHETERRGRGQNRFTRPKSHKKNHLKYNSKYFKQTTDKYWAAKKRGWPNEALKNNDVAAKSQNSIWGTNECSESALLAMGNRMLDWFSVIMADSRRRPNNPNSGPSWCKPEVWWMQGHLDTDGDGRLSARELYRLEHDDREKCIKPFMDRCDLDRDLFLSSREWCKCFDKSERPCAALRRASKDLMGGYIPECDSEGYYRASQCHLSANMCWCVDKHGIEVPGTRARGNVQCDTISGTGNRRRTGAGLNVDDEDVDSYEGSANGEEEEQTQNEDN